MEPVLEDEEGTAKAAKTVVKTAEPWTQMSTWDLRAAAVLLGVAVQLAAVVLGAAAVQVSDC